MSPSVRMQEYRTRERQVIRAAERVRQLREANRSDWRSEKPLGQVDVGVEIITSSNDG